MERELNEKNALELVLEQLEAIKEFQWIAQFRIIDCYVDEIWNGIPEEIRTFVNDESLLLLQNNPVMDDSFPPILNRYLETCRALSLPRHFDAEISKKCISENDKEFKILTSFMTPKKVHEVLSLTDCITNQLAAAPQCRKLFDFGSGLGYLSRVLNMASEYEVIAVDASESNSASANRQSSIIEDNLSRNKKRLGAGKEVKSVPTIKYFCSFVEDDCNLNAFSSDQNDVPFGIVGLHCCGDLTPTMMRLFKANVSAHALICVGCCYYKMKCRQHSNSPNTNSAVNASGAILASSVLSPVGGDTYCNFPLSAVVKELEGAMFDHSNRFHTAIMKIACDGTDEADDEGIQSTIYRTLLEKLLRETNPQCDCIYSIKFNFSFSKPFSSYVAMVLQKMKMRKSKMGGCAHDDIPAHMEAIRNMTAQELDDFYLQYSGMIGLRISLTEALRKIISGVYESLILLDRYLFLKEDFEDVFLYPIFDQSLSPRNMVLVCKRKQL